jgi:DNA-binding LacI/PurR family transcriptional regulator
MPVRLKDIAHDLGLSVVTVSKVLRHHPDIGEETRKRVLKRAGLRIPEDVAVVGCGNLSYSDFLRVPLSLVDQGSKLIGKHAAALALKLAHNKAPMRPKSELLPPHIVVRASSLRVSAKP